MRVAVAILLALATLCVAKHAVERTVLMSRSETVLPKHYVFTDIPDRVELMRIYFALPKRNMDFVLAELEVISDPLSARYGDWYTTDAVQALTAADPVVHALLTTWLRKFVPASAIRSRGDSIDVIAPVAIVEKMFQTTVKAFKHQITGRRALVAVGDFSLPAPIAAAVLMVTGISDFPIPRRSASYAQAEARFKATGETGSDPYNPPSSYSVNSALGQGFWPNFGRKVPQTMKALYNISASLNAVGIIQAPVEFQGTDCYMWQDFQTYQTDIGMEFINITGILGEGSFSPTSCQPEANLDVEQIQAFGVGATTYYFTASMWIYEWAQDYLTIPAAQSPSITSLSWGYMEADNCQIDSQICSQLGVNSTGYIEATNDEMAKLALAGKTMVICTQDEGAPSDNNVDLTNVLHPVWPIFPASSPYGLAVGATSLLDAYQGGATKAADIDYSSVPICSKIHCSQGTVEAAAMSPNAAFTSGGGFSTVSLRPDWQDAAVTAYLGSNGLRPTASRFASNGRAYPDISAVGEAHFYYAPSGGSSSGGGSSTGSSSSSFVEGTNIHFEGGTSASTPIVAGIMSLINAHSVATTGKTIGFVTPLFYTIGAQYPEAFMQPIASNNTCTGWGRGNPCCQVARADGVPTLGKVCNYGYSTVETLNWNPVVGFGTINVGNFIEAMDKLAAIRAANAAARK